MKPLIYGYLRLNGDEPDAEIRRTELVLKGYADLEGYRFATIFHEYGRGTLAAFDDLVAELKRAEAHDVIVSSVAQFSAHPILCNHMIERLALDADAQVHELADLRLPETDSFGS